MTYSTESLEMRITLSKECNIPGYTLASLISLTAALSTMFLTVNRLMALSLGTQREQLEQRMKLTLPRPFLLRPPFLLFLVYKDGRLNEHKDRHPRVEKRIRLKQKYKTTSFRWQIEMKWLLNRIDRQTRLTIFYCAVERRCIGRRRDLSMIGRFGWLRSHNPKIGVRAGTMVS
jgi:hypothetical protein